MVGLGPVHTTARGVVRVNSGNPVVLHIGVHKTGSTALQAALAAARPELQERGVLYPGRDEAHHAAAWAVTGFTMGYGEEATSVRSRNWPVLVRQARRHDGPVMISSEFFGRMRAPAVRRVVSDLGTDRLQVVFAVRRLGDLLPSSWQQYLKSGLTVPYRDWLKDVLTSDEPETTKGFWYRADFAELIRRWKRVLPPDRMTAVILEPTQRDRMYRVTEDMLGLPAGLLEPHRVAGRENRSMTAVEAEAVRRTNLLVRDTMGWAEYSREIRHGAIRAMVENRVPPEGEPRIVTPRWALRKAVRRQERDRRRILSSGINVVGDADHLLTRPTAATIQQVTQFPADIADYGLIGAR